MVLGIGHWALGIDDDQVYGILLAEDGRAPTAESLQTIITGTGSSDPAVRAVAVRALGRLERLGLADSITPLLEDSDPGVRREAANALGQATLEATGSEPACLAVAAALTDRLALEGDAAVRGVILRTLGRLPHADAARVRATEEALVEYLNRSLEEQDGAVRGLNRLFARRPDVERRLSPEVAAALGDVVRGGRDARTRRVALQTLAAGAALDDAVADAAWRNTDWETRRLAVPLGADLAGGARRARQALTDASPQVRFEAVRAIGQRNQIPCGPVTALVNDPDPHVARRALQTLALPCEGGSLQPLDILAGIAARDGEHARKDWRLAAAALGSYASACATAQASARPSSSCQRARDVARLHARGEPWQLRMHSAQPVGSVGDRDTLRRLSRDPHPNVRTAAIEQLAAMKNDADADVMIAALSAADYQLVLTAARALKGRTRPDAVSALRAAFDRLSAKKSDTARDPLTAIRDTLSAGGVDVTVPSSAPKAAPFGERELADLRARPLRAIITMESGGTIELELVTGEAPATVARFVRLARKGVYDGLTFHRVEPNFVIQGGSPGANEYAGHDPYLRDEVGLVSHERGTVGISTRGHDTGDAQIFVNLVDNFRLDHRYTVFARVVRGMQVVDQVVEGDAMARVVIR
ncbi:MAG TPA: peptidylprolyl isomerase [Vicinamibacterales bacterium]|nr:peptidylprolyl isomerase [Vicinamibacterales bacterium]